jgi:hypothetical protein
MASQTLQNKLCGLCNQLAINDVLKELTSDVVEGLLGQEEKSLAVPWYQEIATVNSSAISCQLCELVLQGLRADRKQLVEKERNSGDWPSDPGDLYDDIMTIKWYSKLSLDIAVRSRIPFSRRYPVKADLRTTENLKLHAFLRVTCGEINQASWDGYAQIKAELRLSDESCKQKAVPY